MLFSIVYNFFLKSIESEFFTSQKYKRFIFLYPIHSIGECTILLKIKQDLVLSVELHLGLIPYPLTIDPCPLFMAPGLNIANKVWVLNSKSLVHFVLVDFRWWVPILGMVSDHPCDGG